MKISRSSKFTEPWSSQRRFRGAGGLGLGAEEGLRLRFYSCHWSQSLNTLVSQTGLEGQGIPRRCHFQVTSAVGPTVSRTEGNSSTRKIFYEPPENVTFLCWDGNNSFLLVPLSFSSCFIDDLIYTPWAMLETQRWEDSRTNLICFLWTSECRGLGFLVEPVPEVSKWSAFPWWGCCSDGEGECSHPMPWSAAMGTMALLSSNRRRDLIKQRNHKLAWKNYPLFIRRENFFILPVPHPLLPSPYIWASTCRGINFCSTLSLQEMERILLGQFPSLPSHDLPLLPVWLVNAQDIQLTIYTCAWKAWFRSQTFFSSLWTLLHSCHHEFITLTICSPWPSSQFFLWGLHPAGWARPAALAYAAVGVGLHSLPPKIQVQGRRTRKMETCFSLQPKMFPGSGWVLCWPILACPVIGTWTLHFHSSTSLCAGTSSVRPPGASRGLAGRVSGVLSSSFSCLRNVSLKTQIRCLITRNGSFHLVVFLLFDNSGREKTVCPSNPFPCASFWACGKLYFSTSLKFEGSLWIILGHEMCHVTSWLRQWEAPLWFSSFSSSTVVPVEASCSRWCSYEAVGPPSAWDAKLFLGKLPWGAHRTLQKTLWEINLNWVNSLRSLLLQQNLAYSDW